MFLFSKGLQFTFKHDSCVYLQLESILESLAIFHVVLLCDLIFLTGIKLEQKLEALCIKEMSYLCYFLSESGLLVQSHYRFPSKNMPSILTSLHLYPTLKTHSFIVNYM